MSIIQRSIEKTNAKLLEYRRQIAIALKHQRQANEKADAALELIIDEVCFQTGLQLTPENMPLIATYVKQVLRDQRREQQQQEDGDDGMSDHLV
jgi:hypothetical protein